MYRENQNNFAIVDIQHGQYGEYLKQHLKNVAQNDGVNTNILIESGTVGGASKFLFNEYASYLQGFRCYQSEPIGSKSDRAYAFRQAILDGKIHVYLEDDIVRGEFIKQLTGFPLIKHDDIVDACSYAFNWLNKLSYGSMIKVSHIKYKGSAHKRHKRNYVKPHPLLSKRYF